MNENVKVGKFASVWQRKSGRHKWTMTRAFVLICHVSEGCVSWQESTSGGETRQSWTSCNADPKYYKFDEPHFDVFLA